jgi:hypothetical protein
MPDDTARPDVKQQLTRALRRWEGEGGAVEDDGLAASESNVLKCLGAAVVMTWNDLPMPVQRALFRHAAAVDESYDTTDLKNQIARFLHLHKDDDPQSGS